MPHPLLSLAQLSFCAASRRRTAVGRFSSASFIRAPALLVLSPQSTRSQELQKAPATAISVRWQWCCLWLYSWSAVAVLVRLALVASLRGHSASLAGLRRPEPTKPSSSLLSGRGLPLGQQQENVGSTGQGIQMWQRNRGGTTVRPCNVHCTEGAQ